MDVGRSTRGRATFRLLPLLVVGCCLASGLAACSSAARTGGSVNPTYASAAAPRPQVTTSTPTAVPPPAACQQWGCRARQSINLTGGYSVTLWLGADELNFRSRPVVEELENGVAVQWWISAMGDGWNGSLTCSTNGPEPNCILIDSLGMHANVAEMLILHSGTLVHPAAAQAVTDSVGMRSADLNGDGYLDVIGTINDYEPNYAQGHNYWQTFQYRDDRLTVTGCGRQASGAPAPTRLLTGACPAK